MSLPSKRGLKRVADDERERAAGGQRLECRRDLFGLHAHVQDDKIVGDFGQVDVEGERPSAAFETRRGSRRLGFPMSASISLCYL